MGELDTKSFLVAAKRRAPSKEVSEHAIKLPNLWQERMRDPNWHHFKVVTVEGNSKEIIDEVTPGKVCFEIGLCFSNGAQSSSSNIEIFVGKENGGTRSRILSSAMLVKCLVA